jgi:hypothetical protein
VAEELKQADPWSNVTTSCSVAKQADKFDSKLISGRDLSPNAYNTS